MEGQEMGFNPAHALGNVYTLLSGLRDQVKEEGHYLLKHDSAFGAFVKVMKKEGERGRSYDLHAPYSVIHPSDDLKVKPVFRPLDFKTLTPWHFFNGRVPGLFQPKIDEGRLKQSRGRGRGRGGRGRGRGRG